MTPDPRFHQAPRGPFTVAEIAQACGASIGEGTGTHRRLAGVAPLQNAGPDDVSFFDNPRYLSALAETRAGAVILPAKHANRVPAGTVPLVAAAPHLAWAKTVALFFPPVTPEPGIHPTAVVAGTALLGPRVRIEAGAVIGERAAVGAGSVIGANAVIGPGVVLGRDCRIGPGASIVCTIAGDRLVVHAGVRIGQDGFGFASGPEGHVPIPQLGRVLIGDDVEIGANTTIDRGSLTDTVIGSGTRMDNLVQIGHNVRLGRGCIIVAQVGIAGSAVVEDGAVVAGQAGIAGHLTIGRGARIGAQSGVMTDIPPGETWVGSPARPAVQTMRAVAALERLARQGR